MCRCRNTSSDFEGLITEMQSSSNTVARRLSQLALLYERGQASELMDRTLDKLFAYEIESSRSKLSQLEEDLAGFEERYGMSSEDFYRRFQVGQTDDRMDYVEWASLFQMAENLRQRLELLEHQIEE